jgi:ABC-type nitrate/sulfonate/bicarbonate transport system permease component
LLIWQFLSSQKIISPILLPSPEKVLLAALNMLKSGQLLSSLAASVGRILAGFSLAALVSVPLGLFLGFSKKARQILEPALAFLRYTPPSAFIPLMIVWFGISETQKIAFIFYCRALLMPNDRRLCGQY